MEEFKRLLGTPRNYQRVPRKSLRPDFYSFYSKSRVALVHTNDRSEGIKEAFRLMGGISPLIKGVKGDILIKPNCNHDIPFPRNTHPETVRFIAEELIVGGFDPKNIVIGDMSGIYRGLPSRTTMKNLGLIELAEELNTQISFFEEEEWVLVDDTGRGAWPNGIKIPRKVYEAERIIMTPILRPHTSAAFSMTMKLPVGIMDLDDRQFLHNGERFYEKLIGFNSAFSIDLSVIDGLKCYIDRGPNFNKMVEPGVIIVGSNRVATDIVAVGVMKYFKAYGLDSKPILEHKQIFLAEKYGLKNKEQNIDLQINNMTDDKNFEKMTVLIEKELSS
jgi:uncharacterized protein (DUF362 family)